MKVGRTNIRLLKTGVPGLDQVLGGGLPEFSFNLIAGAPGSGKTTLAHQIMFASASVDKPALYFTAMGEPPIKMLRYQQQFDFFDLEKLNHAIVFTNLAEKMATGDLDQVLAHIAAEVEALGPSLVFVDSFGSFLLEGQAARRDRISAQLFIQNLGVMMASWQATTFLIGEHVHELEPNPVLTVCDGLIWLRQSLQGNSIVRKMEIMKMRGQATLPGLHTFQIAGDGVQVFAPQPLQAPPREAPELDPHLRLKSGVEGLDAMLGGGLPRGYSLLVAGPSGSGKSILATAFLAEGARHGEAGVIAAFEQRALSSRGPLLASLIEQGRVAVVDTRSLSLSVDEIAEQLIQEIRRLNASRVVIDSLSGFELALAPTFRDEFRESLARLVSALSSTGATVLMTSELEDRYDDLRFSPYGTAFLTDAIIVQRYVELESRLQRVIAVVKLRASAHSNELRLFHIDAQGLHIGEPVLDHEALLSGRPRPIARHQGSKLDGNG